MKLNCLPGFNFSFRLFYFTLSIGLLVFVSCTPVKRSYYFKGLEKDTTISGFIPNTYESKIKRRDNLSIVVSSLSAVEDALFNQSSLGGVSAGVPGFIVDEQGNILLHRLGNVQVEGLTRRELEQKLQKDLLPYMKEPIVNVNYLNRKVTVIGEVGGPKVLDLTGEQMPLLDVLIASGDIAVTGRRDNVVVIRELEDQKQVKHINLEDLSLFTSPFYYVQPNDIIYVMPDIEKQEKQDRKNDIQRNIGFLTAGISFLFIIIDRLFR